MRDRYIGKCLADHRYAMATDLLDRGRFEYASRRWVECLGVVELGFLREKDVLRQEFALEAIEIAAQRLLAIGELPVPGHRLDAEQVRGLDHVGALHGIGKPGALPQIAAIEQQRTFMSNIAAQALDQRLQLREAAELAEANSGFLEIEEGEGVGIGAVGPYSKPIEKGAADQMRRLALHRADPEIDTRLAKKNRQQLRVRVGDVQDARIAEVFEIVHAGVVGAAPDARHHARERGCAREFEKLPAADGHAMSPLLEILSVFRAPSRPLSRFSPGRSKPWPALRLPSTMQSLRRSRRHRRLFSRPPRPPRSRSIDCAGCRLACWRRPPRRRLSCSRPRSRRPARTLWLRSAAPKPARASISCLCSWPRSRAGNRQPVAQIGQIIFEIAIFVGL